MKHCIILGTRPEIVKLSSTIRFLQETQRDFYILHTNQHYSPEMDEVFFRELHLPAANINLNVGSGSHAAQTAKMLTGIEQALISNRPDVVYVQGDTNTVLAGALVASKLSIPVAHVEAGLRSYDRTMPEELNRIIADHVSRLLFAPTDRAVATLRAEQVESKWIFNVGNPITDAVTQGLSLPPEHDSPAESSSPYFLLTLHRPGNVDDEKVFREIWSGLAALPTTYGVRIIFPIHPRTKMMMEKFDLVPFDGLQIIEPCGFLPMLRLEQGARLILTDSGGIQEEACILSKPTVTIRDNTERPETIEAGINVLGGRTSISIQAGVEKMMAVTSRIVHPYGDGKSGKHMVEIAERELSR